MIKKGINERAGWLFQVHAPALYKAVLAAAEIDCLISFSKCARENNYHRPVLSEESDVLHIENGRHMPKP
jgi:DNA mismatch repair ATPase MutS